EHEPWRACTRVDARRKRTLEIGTHRNDAIGVGAPTRGRDLYAIAYVGQSELEECAGAGVGAVDVACDQRRTGRGSGRRSVLPPARALDVGGEAEDAVLDVDRGLRDQSADT